MRSFLLQLFTERIHLVDQVDGVFEERKRLLVIVEKRFNRLIEKLLLDEILTESSTKQPMKFIGRVGTLRASRT